MTDDRMLATVHAKVEQQGWALVSGKAIGLPDPEIFRRLFIHRLVRDPRGPGKRHARDVMHYERDASPLLCGTRVAEADDIAFYTEAGQRINDFSRMEVAVNTLNIPQIMLSLVPHSMRRDHGIMSADYFEYAPGVSCPPHKDGFGDNIIIWSLFRSRDAQGCFNKLHPDDGLVESSLVLVPGDVLIFRDDRFSHSVTELKAGTREAVIFIDILPAEVF